MTPSDPERSPARIREMVRRATHRRDFRGEAEEMFKTLCESTGSDYGGAFAVQVDGVRNAAYLTTYALGGREAPRQTRFRHWLDTVIDLREDAMVNAIAGTLSEPRFGLQIVRGEVLPHAFFLSADEQREKEGISEVSDILIGYYPTAVPLCFIAMCLYRLDSKRRYMRKELDRLGHAVGQHAELYREGEVGWSWRWWELLTRREWEAWRLVATLYYTDEEIAKCWGKSVHTVGRVMGQLFWKLRVKNRAHLTALYYEPSLIDDEVFSAVRTRPARRLR